MDVSLGLFLQEVVANPILAITVLLTLGVIFVNGWTDAPNAIATCVTTRCMNARPAIIMSAIFNFMGVLIMTHINASVPQPSPTWSTSAPIRRWPSWRSARPSSPSWFTAWRLDLWHSHEREPLAHRRPYRCRARHAGRLDGVNGEEWVKVIYGLVLSLAIGFALGWGICKGLTILCRNIDRRRANGFFTGAQIFGAAAMSFMHGAQDGQKFIGVLLLGVAFCNGQPDVSGAVIPVWLMILCSTVMGIGTSVGGEKIIKSVGMDMVKLEKYQGFSADLAGAICILLSTVFGIPVSTTHTKTSAIMGVGAVKRSRPSTLPWCAIWCSPGSSPSRGAASSAL